MIQPETLLSQSWSPYEDMMNSTLDQFFEYDDHLVGDCGFSAIFNTSSSDEVLLITPFPSSNNTDHHIHIHDNIPHTISEDTLYLPSLMEDFSMELDHDFDPTTTMMMNSQISCIQESQGSFQSPQNFSSEVVQEYASSPTPSMKSELSSIQQPSLNFPQIQNQLTLHHLVEACKEALEKGQKALAEEILRCTSQKVTPLGDSFERFAFYFSQDMTNLGDYLKAEALKNFEAAFRAFYQGTPYGKFAHFTAFSAILEAVPQDCDSIHIFDSYMGIGIQLIPMIEAISHMNRTLKIKYTSIKRGDESPEVTPTYWNFDETNRHLCEHASSCGLKLKVEEKEMKEVVAEIKKMNKRGEKKVFLAFNCMVDLPHMGKVRSRREARDFLRLAKDLIKSSGNKGIITFGDGDSFEKLKSCLNFSSFFEGQLVHYHALLESVESHFPTSFSEARTAMECLFVAPNVSPFAWIEKWEEMKSDYCCHLQGEEIGFEGYRFSKNTLLEVKEMLRGSEGSYQAKIEGQNGNELVLAWKGTELVRISAWRN